MFQGCQRESFVVQGRGMSSSLEKLKALSKRLEREGIAIPTLPKKEKRKVATIRVTEPFLDAIVPQHQQVDVQIDTVREDNIARVKRLYEKLNIFEKSPDFSQIFIYKAMNLSGIGLKEDDFGEVRKGKYIQIIAITYEPDKNGKKKAKNISLGYFGKAELLEEVLKNDIIEFVLRWRYEKAFQNVEHYKDLIKNIGR
jgi:hypothetical protein